MSGGGRRLLLAALIGLAACTAAEPATPTSYVVLFDTGAMALDAAALAVVHQAAAAARSAPRRMVAIAGFSERPGAPQADQIRARLRASVVADALLADGVARSRIALRPVARIGGDPAIERRRVEIVLGD